MNKPKRATTKELQSIAACPDPKLKSIARELLKARKELNSLRKDLCISPDPCECHGEIYCEDDK